METAVISVFAVVVACGLLPFFLIPAYFSLKENHPQKWMILIANILLLVVAAIGWITSMYTIGVIGMLAGYIACLRWSLSHSKAHEQPLNATASKDGASQ
jgi:hypothetical protein